jgi:hypothetical protein
MLAEGAVHEQVGKQLVRLKKRRGGKEQAQHSHEVQTAGFQNDGAQEKKSVEDQQVFNHGGKEGEGGGSVHV